MTEQQLIVLKRQPNFPDEDLTESNADLVAYSLVNDRSEVGYSEWLGLSLVPWFKVGHEALTIRELPTEDSARSYGAFREGFAATEYALTLVRQGAYNGTRAVEQTNELFMRSEAAAPSIISERYLGWLATHGNTFGVIADVSLSREDTIKQTQARAMGAYIATQMQRGGLLIS